MKKKLFSLFPFFLVCGLSLLTLVPLFSGGFFPIHDDTQVARVFEMWNSLRIGMFPVRWVEHLGYGFGYPIFNFYGPLSYYIGALFMSMGMDALLATKFVFGIVMVGSGVSMYFLARELLGKIVGVVSAIVYVFFPYHAVNMYVRGALNELTAYALIPLVFLGFIKIARVLSEKKYSVSDLFPWIVLLTFSLSLTAIAHNLSFFMVCIFLTLFVVCYGVFIKRKRDLIITLGISGIITFLISSFYILPVAFETQFTNVSSQVGGGADYPDHFVCISQLWNSAWGFGGSTPGCFDGLSFKLGKTNILLGLVSFMLFLYYIFRNKKRENVIFFLTSLISLVLSLFLMIHYSKFLWDTIPFMEFLQYPWRFLNFSGLFLSIIIGYIIFFVKKIYSNKFIILVIGFVIVGVTLFYNYKLFNPQSRLDKTSEEYISEEELVWRVSKISDEYMPEKFDKPQSVDEIREDPVEIVKGIGIIEEIYHVSGNVKAKVTIREPSTIRLNIAYFPGWKFSVNGENIESDVRNDGIYIPLSVGEHNIQAELTSTTIQRIGNVLSIVGILALFLGIITFEFIQRYGKKTS